MSALSPKIKLAIISVIGILAAAWAGLYFYWLNAYQDRIYPGVSVGSVDLGGTTREQAANLLLARTEKISDGGLSFRAEGKEAVMPVTEVSFDSALSYPVLTFDNERMVAEAFGSEENRTFWRYLWSLARPGRQGNIPAAYTLDHARVSSWLEENFSEFTVAPQNAYFSWEEKGGVGLLTVNNEIAGRLINAEKAWKDLASSLDNLATPDITLQIITAEPQIKATDLSGQEGAVRAAVSGRRLALSLPNSIKLPAGERRTWMIPGEKLVTWIKTSGETLSVDEEKAAAYLSETIAPAVDQEAVLPRFEMKDGRVASWQTGKAGYRLDTAASAGRIAAEFNAGNDTIELVTEEITAVDIAADNGFQIKEIIGTGHSRFAGSPANRRHNIRVGASALHGLLIKPGEEFSLLKALGEIDGAAGYLPELVIKGDKTVPEYGGGLCQIGTTVFRSALASGLPITQRRNHSYRVSYYEPAGTDATIYDPAPDFRFLNDTGNYILIQTRIDGDDLYFDFWGIKDGRTATTTDPVIYNIVKPAPTKIVETDDLAPGQKKCTESAHNGADAYFDYTVVYPEGATTTPVQTRRFSSHYIPWQAVCLVGRSATSTPSAGDQATTTTAATTTPSSTPTN